MEIGYFGIGLNSGRKASYPQVEISDYIKEINAGRPSEIADMASLKTSHEIRIVENGEGDKKRKRRIYDCLVWEVDRNNEVFVLFSGQWYRVEKAFYQDVEKDFQALLVSSADLLSTKAKNERQLIADLDLRPDLIKLDQAKISPSGAAAAALEPCDFFCRVTRRFIHLKDGHSSEPISHLWNQGLVSAESFVRDAKFRKGLRAEVVKRERRGGKAGFHTLLPASKGKPNPAEFKVVFGIMRTRYVRSNTMGIPFFSKVSLRPVATRIRNMGFSVEVSLIEKL